MWKTIDNIQDSISFMLADLQYLNGESVQD